MSTGEGKNQGNKYTCSQGGRAAPRPLGTAGRTCARCTARVRTHTAYRCTSHTTYMRSHHIYIANMYHNTHMTQLTAPTRVHELSFGGVHGCCGRPQSLRCCRQRLEGCQGRGHSRPPQEQAGVGGHRLPGSLPAQLASAAASPWTALLSTPAASWVPLPSCFLPNTQERLEALREATGCGDWVCWVCSGLQEESGRCGWHSGGSGQGPAGTEEAGATSRLALWSL